MTAWVVDRPGPIDSMPLARVDPPVPVPGFGQVRLEVRTCGVCRTDLHLAEGDLTPKHPRVTPGHEVVGIVDRSDRVALGSGWGTGWACRGSPTHVGSAGTASPAGRTSVVSPRFTGWDIDGGYAEYRGRRRGLRVPITGRLQRCAGSAAALRGNHRLPGAAAVAAPPGRSTRASTDSAVRPTSRPRSPWPRGRRVHVMTRSPEARELALAARSTQRG